MSLLKKLAGHTLIYGGALIIPRLINVAFTPIYTNIFPKEIYGIYTNLYAWVAFAIVLLTFGMETTFFRFVSDAEDPRATYNQTFTWVGLMALVWLLIAGLPYKFHASWLGYSGQEHLVLMMVFIVVLDALFALPMARMRYKERLGWFTIITLTNVIITLLANIIFVVVMKLGIEYVFISNLIASSIRLCMAFWKNMPSSLSLKWVSFKGMLHYGFFIMIAGLAGIMNETLDRILIPFRWGEAEQMFGGLLLDGQSMNGIYGANYKVAMLIALATQAFRYAAEPIFFKEARNEKSPQSFARIFHYFMLAALIGFLFIGSFDREIAAFDFFGIFGEGKTFLNKDYWSGLQAIPVLLAAYVFLGAYVNLSIWYKITKQTRFAILFTGAGALVTILINYFGIPVYGYMASAWATLLSYSLMVVLVYLAGQRYYPVPYRIGRLLLYSLFFMAAWLLNRAIGPTDGYFAAFFMKLLVSLMAIGAVVLVEWLRPIRWDEG